MSRRDQALGVKPLTAELWPAFAELFESQGNAACNRCWCMYWRIGTAYRHAGAAANREAFHEIVKAGPRPPGLVALQEDGVAIGWCQLTPRSDLVHLNQARNLAPVDDVPVWCISCFYVRKGHRRQGVTALLIDAAIRRAREAKAPALEAYPLDGSSSSSFTGYASSFLRAGFHEVERRNPTRPILRLDIIKQ